ncbi:MAG: hypothetical protein JO010_12500 [Alphaproteobacteria bacterium]|nr:hypothetical protein [Alphaproteobacteria bacterium]
MIAARTLARQDAFADETSGFDYFTSDAHCARLAAGICRELTRRGFVLVSGEPAPDMALLAGRLDDAKAGFRIAVVRCRTGMGFDEIVTSFGRAIGAPSGGDNSGRRLWPIVAHLIQEARKGVQHVLALEAADALADEILVQLHKLANLDDPPILPIILTARPSFSGRLEAPSLEPLKAAVTASFPLQRLDADEVAAFITHQLGGEDIAFPAETIAAIANSAQGDPVLVNRLARGTLDFLRRTGAKLAPPAPVIPLDAAPSAPRQSAAAGEASSGDAAPPSSAPPLGTVSPKRQRMALRLAVAAYLLAIAVSGGAVFYLLAPGQSRSSTVDIAAAVATPPREAAMAAMPISDVAATQSAAVAPQPASDPAPQAAAERLPPPATETPLQPAAEPLPQAAAEPAPPLASEPAPAPARAAESAPPPAAEPPVEAASLAATLPAGGGAAPDPSPRPDVPGPMAAPQQALDDAVRAAAAPPDPAAEAPAAGIALAAATPAPPAAAAPADLRPPDLLAASVAAPVPRTAEAPIAVASLSPEIIAPAARESMAPRAPEAPAETAPNPPSTISPAETGILIQRGNELLGAGDIVSARLFFERAALAGDRRAAGGLGRTYDPLFLQEVGARGMPGNPAIAANWYRAAAQSGDAEAEARLNRLAAKYPAIR